LRGWPYEPGPGEILVREVSARDGRTVVQVRIELGILQMEREGRPDGERPHGFETYLEYLRHRAKSRLPKNPSGAWVMAPEQCTEADREFVQYYHRRVAWLALNRFDRALRDANHSLELMDFVSQHGMNELYIVTHERLRGLVLFHRTQAAAALALEKRKPDEALDLILEGEEALRRHQTEWAEQHADDELPDSALIEQLKVQEREIRKNFAIGKTLREQLADAIESEDYELAARLRDEMKQRGNP
jgi:hypothetical protein